MPKGGKRPGAGRPRNPENIGLDFLPATPGFTARQFLRRVSKHSRVPIALRIRAAKAVMPYLHARGEACPECAKAIHQLNVTLLTNDSAKQSHELTPVETAAAASMIRAARILIETRMSTRPAYAAAIRAALREDVEIEAQLRIGALPSVRIITVGAEGEVAATICALDLNPALLAG